MPLRENLPLTEGSFLCKPPRRSRSFYGTFETLRLKIRLRVLLSWSRFELYELLLLMSDIHWQSRFALFVFILDLAFYMNI